MQHRQYLLLGCGDSRDRKLVKEGSSSDFSDGKLVTLDVDAEYKPDVVFDLSDLFYGAKLPFDDDAFDEIHAYEVLERVGEMGNWRGFFNEWREYWRVLKPEGLFYGTVSSFDSPVALCEPSHVRVLDPGLLAMMLDQSFHDGSRGNVPVISYRSHWFKPYDFKLVYQLKHGYTQQFVLQKQVAE